MKHIRIIAGPVEVRAQPGQFAAPIATYPRQSGEVMTVGANMSEQQARELVASGRAVDAYGGAPFWRTMP